jgi:SGNH hydrolase-like domain, acetyltransferase AlgX
MSEQQRPKAIDRLNAGAWHFGLELMFWSAGGFLVTRMEPPGPVVDANSVSVVLLSGMLIGVLLSGGAALRMRGRRRGKWALFSTVFHATLLLAAAILAEWAVRPFVPEWPARELHGVTADEWARAQAPFETSGDSVGINTWGQRDRERTLQPPEGSFRIACIGDSFLEEGAPIPVSLLIERQLDRDDVEVLNLGVSATSPDEYYARARHVAIPLGAGHCIVFVYAGNDFVTAPRTLESYGGIAAVAPRPSLLRLCGLGGVNHVLTNRRRPVIQAWFAAGDLAARELAMHDFIATADDDVLRYALLNADELMSAERTRLAERLSRPEMADFFDILRKPDGGRFRSYYLSAALWSASVGGGQWDPNSPVNALYWVEQTVNHCRGKGVTVTVVIVPDGFQVDPRLVEQWSPLADMKHLTEPTREAAAEFRDQGLARGWDVLDLHESLDGIAGAYLNVDGHWSQAGAAAAGDAVVEHLRTHYDF